MTLIASVAHDIVEDLLQRTGFGLQSGGFEGFADCFVLPYVIETFKGRSKITDRAELRDRFNAARRFYQSRGVTRLERRCVEATFKSADVIWATHETRLMNDMTLLEEPYPVLAFIHKMDGVWRTAHSKFAVTDEHAEMLIGTNALARRQNEV